MAKIKLLTQKEARRLHKVVKHVESRMPYKPARRNPPRRIIGSCNCVTVIEIRLEGTVTGGTFDLDVTIDDGTSTSNETLTFNYNANAAAIQTEFETHTLITASTDIDVIGGPFPNVAAYVVFLSSGNLNRYQSLPLPDATSLTGTNAVVKVAYMTNVNWQGG